MNTPYRIAPKRILVVSTIVAVFVAIGVVLHVEWPKRLDKERSSSYQTPSTATSSLPKPILGPPSVEAAPSVTWTPASVTQQLPVGQTKTVFASFTAAEIINNAVIRVVPEIASFVRVTPASFGSIAKGQEINLTITFFAPVTSETDTLEGTIQLRSAVNPPRNFAQPLPVTLIIQGLPPDPGAAGKATLQGIDSDGDSVRDDVQRYIVLTYPNSEKTRAGLRQLAMTNQDFILNSNAPEATLLNIVTRRHRAADCLDYVSGGPENALALLRDLRAQILNTKQRSLAYADADRRLSGKFFPITDPATFKNSCDFDPDSLQ